MRAIVSSISTFPLFRRFSLPRTRKTRLEPPLLETRPSFVLARLSTLSKTSNSRSALANSETPHPSLLSAPRTRDLTHRSFGIARVVSTRPRNTPQSSSRPTSSASSNTPDTPERKSASPRSSRSFLTASSTKTSGVTAALIPPFRNLSALTLRFRISLATSTRTPSCLPAKTASVLSPLPPLICLHSNPPDDYEDDESSPLLSPCSARTREDSFAKTGGADGASRTRIKVLGRIHRLSAALEMMISRRREL